MDQAGWTMLNVGKWLAQEKSFEITGAGLFISAVLLILFLGFVAGMKWDQKRSDLLEVGQNKFYLVGVAQVPGEQGIFMPVYKEVRK